MYTYMYICVYIYIYIYIKALANTDQVGDLAADGHLLLGPGAPLLGPRLTIIIPILVLLLLLLLLLLLPLPLPLPLPLLLLLLLLTIIILIIISSVHGVPSPSFSTIHFAKRWACGSSRCAMNLSMCTSAKDLITYVYFLFVSAARLIPSRLRRRGGGPTAVLRNVVSSRV